MLDECFGCFDFAPEHLFQLQRIYRCLPLVVIISHNKRFLRLVSNVRDLLFPSLEFLGLVKIVVAVIAIVSLEPLFVVSPV